MISRQQTKPLTPSFIFVVDLTLFYLSQIIDLIWDSQTSEHCMVEASHKVFMVKDGAKFHTGELVGCGWERC